MRTHRVRTLAVIATLLPAIAAMRSINAPLEVQPESKLWAAGTSTVRAFQCQATSFDAKVESPTPGAVAAVLAGEKSVGAIEVAVPTDRLDCKNGTMNAHMLKALKAKEHPVIAFRVSSYELSRAEAGVEVQLTGTLILGGVEKTIAITAQATPSDDGALHVTGTHELRMSDYGLKPPSLMLGTMRVHDKIKVGFDIVLKDRAE
jgi:polyisoprenoid-binding protein YceI